MPPSSLQDLIKTITPPRGVKVKSPTAGASPLDEGNVLFDCDRGEIEDGDEIVPANVESSDEDYELAPHSSEQASSIATSTGSRVQDSPLWLQCSQNSLQMSPSSATVYFERNQICSSEAQ